MPIYVPAAALPVQLLAHGVGKAPKDGPITWPPAHHLRDLEKVLVLAWPMLDISDNQGLTQQMEDISVSISV